MNNVRLYYIKLAHQNEKTGDVVSSLDETLLQRWSGELNDAKRNKVARLKNVRDKYVSLLGLQLVKQCVIDEGVRDFRLADVTHPESGKPRWTHRGRAGSSAMSEKIDFNITHSADFIAVACSKTLQIGLDAEKIKPLKNLKFKMVMKEQELQIIEKTPEKFFDLWSIKEAVVKAADTTGLARMRDVRIESDHAMLDGGKWFITALADDLNSSDYSVYLASSNLIDNIVIKQLRIETLVTDKRINES